MDTVGQAILFASRQLSDQRRNREFTRWNRKDLLNYLNSGLKEIAAYRAEAFASEQTITLAPGIRQILPEGVSVTGLIDTRTGLPVNEADDALLKTFAGAYTCPVKPKFINGTATYVPKSFAVDRSNPKVFYVSPAVPAGLTASVLVTMEGKAPEYTFQDWDKPIAMQDKFYNNLIDWMMAEAYQMDTESQVSLGQARGLKQAFYSIMGVKYKMDSARNSGFYNGETGTGDPRAVAV